MKFYKATFKWGQRYEYYCAGVDKEPYYFYSLSRQKWMRSDDEIDEIWSSRKQGTNIREVPPLEVMVVVGSFPELYKGE